MSDGSTHQMRLWTMMAVIEREGDQLYNSAVIVGPEGLVGKHRKVNLTPPDIHYFGQPIRYGS